MNAGPLESNPYVLQAQNLRLQYGDAAPLIDGLNLTVAAGEIVDGKAGPGTAGGDRIAKLIDEATASDAPALVLRVDSPGGSVFASEQIRLALERFKAKGRPVVVSMGNVAASGSATMRPPARDTSLGKICRSMQPNAAAHRC